MDTIKLDGDTLSFDLTYEELKLGCFPTTEIESPPALILPMRN